MIPSKNIELIKIFVRLNKNIFFRILRPLNFWFLKLFDFLFFQALFFWFKSKILFLMVPWVFSDRFRLKLYFLSNKFIIWSLFLEWTWIFSFFLALLLKFFENDSKLNWQLNWINRIINVKFWLLCLWGQLLRNHWVFALLIWTSQIHFRSQLLFNDACYF
jgi:hypothetical protein